MSASVLPVDLFNDLDMISEFAIDSMPWVIGKGLIERIYDRLKYGAPIFSNK